MSNLKGFTLLFLYNGAIIIVILNLETRACPSFRLTVEICGHNPFHDQATCKCMIVLETDGEAILRVWTSNMQVL